jgi:nicotinamidase-related amidase
MLENLEAIGQDALLSDAREALALHRATMTLDANQAALVVVDPQIDFSTSLEPNQSAAGLRTIQSLVRLAKAAKSAGIPVAISLTAPRDLHSDTIPALKSYVEDHETIICWPHVMLKSFWVNDVGLRLRQLQITQIILAGLFGSLRIETHLRDFIEQGFEVAVVTDAVAGARIPEGIGYLSALVHFRRIVNALWTTEETVKRLG